MKIKNPSIREDGAYIIKAAESRPRPVVSKPGGPRVAPTGRDRTLVDALIRFKST